MVEVVKFKLGRRGAVLLLYATLFFTVGFGYATAATQNTADALIAATNMTGGELWPWGYVWMLVALIGLVTAFWPPGKDNWGFASMAGLAYLWGSLLIATWMLYGLEPRGWVSGCIFLAFGAALSLIAGWPEPRYSRRSQ